MIPAAFEYYAPKTLKEATGLLQQHGDAAKLLAGGHSLLPMMKLRLATPQVVIDLGGLSELQGIRASDGVITIGALATHYALESSDLLKKASPLLPEVAAQIGDIQVRNRGTIGGSLAHADPAADWPAAILAMSAELVALNTAGKERVIKAREFFTGLFETALQPDEILTQIRVPALAARTGTAYQKVKQPASGFALVGVAARLTVGANGKCEHVALAITGLAASPFRAEAAEAAMRGQTVNAESIAAAAKLAAEGVNDPLEDIHASGEYRCHLARVHARRALERAWAKVGA